MLEFTYGYFVGHFGLVLGLIIFFVPTIIAFIKSEAALLHRPWLFALNLILNCTIGLIGIGWLVLCLVSLKPEREV